MHIWATVEIGTMHGSKGTLLQTNNAIANSVQEAATIMRHSVDATAVQSLKCPFADMNPYCCEGTQSTCTYL